MVGAEIKPAGQRGVAGQRSGFARQRQEDGLRDILREMGVAVQLPQRGRVNQREVTLHQLGKRRLRLLRRVMLQQFGVGGHGSG